MGLRLYNVTRMDGVEDSLWASSLQDAAERAEGECSMAVVASLHEGPVTKVVDAETPRFRANFLPN